MYQKRLNSQYLRSTYHLSSRVGGGYRPVKERSHAEPSPTSSQRGTECCEAPTAGHKMKHEIGFGTAGNRVRVRHSLAAFQCARAPLEAQSWNMNRESTRHRGVLSAKCAVLLAVYSEVEI